MPIRATCPAIETAALEWNRFKTDPLRIPKDLLKLTTLWEGAERIILSVFNHERTAVQAGHAMSKDWCAGILILQWLLTYYGDALVIATGPTDRQVKEIVFHELQKQYLNFLSLYPGHGFYKDWLLTNKLDFKEGGFALGFSTKETNETIGKASGFHAGNVLIIVTEAQAVPSVTYKQIKGLVTSKNSKILELGNPLVEFGDFYQHCTNPKFGYNIIHLPCSESPNVKAKREVIPGMVTCEYIERMRQDCGPDYESDPEYQARVLGEFPQQSRHAWIPLAKIKAAVGRAVPDEDIVVGGLDTAREGSDETVHCVLRGARQTSQDCFRKVLTPETVGWARALIEESGIRMLGIDVGYNPGVFDWLRDMDLPVVDVNFGEASPDERFENLGTYMWWLTRQAFLNDEPSILNDPILVSQLASRRVEATPRGKRRLVSKKKEGAGSPDRADAFVIAWYVRALSSVGAGQFGSAESAAAKLDKQVRMEPQASGKREKDVLDMESGAGEVAAGDALDAAELDL